MTIQEIAEVKKLLDGAYRDGQERMKERVLVLFDTSPAVGVLQFHVRNLSIEGKP